MHDGILLTGKRESKRVRTEGKFLLALTLFNPASLTFEVFDVNEWKTDQTSSGICFNSVAALFKHTERERE